MAQLTSADYRDIRDDCYRPGFGKVELKLLASLPNETTMMSAFQAAEDRTVAAFALFRSDMESALGIPQNAASLTLAQKLFASYCVWKVKSIRGS